MDALQTALGVLIILFILWDVLITVISPHAAGPLTRRWASPLAGGLHTIHRRRRIHGVLAVAGPLMMVFTVFIWYAGLYLGSWLILVARPGTVISSATGLEADLAQIAYFVPTTLSSLGYGDLVPAGFPWTTIMTSMSLLATMVVTVTLSYVIAVLSAAIKRRSLASSVRALGTDPAEFARRANLGSSTGSMQTHLSTLAGDIGHAAAQERAYPVLRHFHSGTEEASLARAVMLLADSFFLLRHLREPDRPSPGLQALVTAEMTDFANVTPVRTETHPHRDTQQRFLRACAERLGIDAGPGSALAAALPGYLDYRAGLVQACINDGWLEV
jgi:hypothetical protein